MCCALQIIDETLPALHKLKDQGLVRHIGITGLPLKISRTVLDRCCPRHKAATGLGVVGVAHSSVLLCRVPPGMVGTVLSYCHYCLVDTSLSSLIPYLENKGVGVINASILSMGLLTPQVWGMHTGALDRAWRATGDCSVCTGCSAASKCEGRGCLVQGPPDWHPAPAGMKEACSRAAQYAQEHGASIATLAIKSALQSPAIQSHLVGFTKPEQVRGGGAATSAPGIHAACEARARRMLPARRCARM